MKERRKDCKYCGKELTEGTTRREFCSDLHRVYWNREHPKVEVKNLNNVTNSIKNVTGQPPKTNYTIDTTKHRLWKAGDPKENTGAFYMKYDCMTYQELENKKP